MPSSLNRRRFLLAAGALSLSSPALGRRRDYVDLREMVGTGGGSHTAIIADAITQARRSGLKIVARAGTYLLDDDLSVDWDGFVLEGEGERARFVQTQPMKGFLQLRGNNARVRGLSFVCDVERQRTSGRWRGYSAFQRACAVWAEGSRNTIEAVSGENTFGVVCLRGPVVPLHAAGASEERQNYNYTKRAIGNRVIEVSGRNTDFVLTGNQQEDLLIDGLTARDTTHKSVPPHAVYMQNPGSTGAFCGYSLRVTAKRMDSVGNSYSEAFKFSDIRELTIESSSARDTVSGLMVSTSDGAVVKGFDWTYRGPKARTAIRVSQSARVRVVGGRSSGNGGAILSYHNSEAVDVEGFEVTDEFAARGSGSPYQVIDTSEARFMKCRRTREGADRPMFGVAGRGTATIEDPECRRSAQLVHCGSDATVNLRIDPRLIDGWAPERSISGAKERVHFSTSSMDAAQRVSRPLPGSAENACP